MHREIDRTQRMQWAVSVAEAIRVIHCDLRPDNLVLDDDSNVYLIDFSGSCLDEKKGVAMENVRFYLPRNIDDDSTEATDLFALGSTMDPIMTGHEPYRDLAEEEVQELVRKNDFPPVEQIPCGRGDPKVLEAGDIYGGRSVQRAFATVTPETGLETSAGQAGASRATPILPFSLISDLASRICPIDPQLGMTVNGRAVHCCGVCVSTVIKFGASSPSLPAMTISASKRGHAKTTAEFGVTIPWRIAEA